MLTQEPTNSTITDPLAVQFMTGGQMQYMPQAQFLTPSEYGAFRTMPTSPMNNYLNQDMGGLQTFLALNQGGPLGLPKYTFNTYNPAVNQQVYMHGLRTRSSDQMMAISGSLADFALSTAVGAAFSNPITGIAASLLMPSLADPLINRIRDTRAIQNITSSKIIGGADMNMATGMGFNAVASRNIDSFIRRSAADDAIFKEGDWRKLLQLGVEFGQFDYATNANQYKDILKKMRGSLTTMMEVIGSTDFRDIMKEFKRMQTMGARTDMYQSISRQENMFARMTGISHADMVNTYGQQGALIYQQAGLTGYQGSLAAMSAAATVTLGQRMGLLDPGTLSRYGGKSGLVQTMTQESASSHNKIMDMVLPYMMNKDITGIDSNADILKVLQSPDALQELATGGLNKLRSVEDMMRYKTMRPKLYQQLIDKYGADDLEMYMANLVGRTAGLGTGMEATRYGLMTFGRSAATTNLMIHNMYSDEGRQQRERERQLSLQKRREEEDLYYNPFRKFSRFIDKTLTNMGESIFGGLTERYTGWAERKAAAANGYVSNGGPLNRFEEQAANGGARSVNATPNATSTATPNAEGSSTNTAGAGSDEFNSASAASDVSGSGGLRGSRNYTGKARVLAYYESGMQGSLHVSYGLPTSDGVDVGKYSFITGGADEKLARSGGSVGEFIRYAGTKGGVGKQLYDQMYNLTGGDWSRLNSAGLWRSQAADIWRNLAKASPKEFEELEDSFMLGRINRVIGQLRPEVQEAIKADKTGALYEMAISTINQHKSSRSILNDSFVRTGGNIEDWVRDVYRVRSSKHSKIGPRMRREVRDILGILQDGGGSGSGSSYSQESGSWVDERSPQAQIRRARQRVAGREVPNFGNLLGGGRPGVRSDEAIVPQEAIDSVDEIINRNVNTYAGNVRYGWNAKNVNSGFIDCSGWVSLLLKKVFDTATEEVTVNGKKETRKVFDSRAINYLNKGKSEAGAAGIIQHLGNLAGEEYQTEDLTPDKIKGGMIIGSYKRGGHGEKEGRYKGISHIVYTHEKNGEVYVTESHSGNNREGVRSIRYEDWYKQTMYKGGKLRGDKRLYGVDIRRLMTNNIDNTTAGVVKNAINSEKLIDEVEMMTGKQLTDEDKGKIRGSLEKHPLTAEDLRNPKKFVSNVLNEANASNINKDEIDFVADSVSYNENSARNVFGSFAKNISTNVTKNVTKTKEEKKKESEAFAQRIDDVFKRFNTPDAKRLFEAGQKEANNNYTTNYFGGLTPDGSVSKADNNDIRLFSVGGVRSRFESGVDKGAGDGDFKTLTDRIGEVVYGNKDKLTPEQRNKIKKAIEDNDIKSGDVINNDRLNNYFKKIMEEAGIKLNKDELNKVKEDKFLPVQAASTALHSLEQRDKERFGNTYNYIKRSSEDASKHLAIYRNNLYREWRERANKKQENLYYSFTDRLDGKEKTNFVTEYFNNKKIGDHLGSAYRMSSLKQAYNLYKYAGYKDEFKKLASEIWGLNGDQADKLLNDPNTITVDSLAAAGAHKDTIELFKNKEDKEKFNAQSLAGSSVVQKFKDGGGQSWDLSKKLIDVPAKVKADMEKGITKEHLRAADSARGAALLEIQEMVGGKVSAKELLTKEGAQKARDILMKEHVGTPDMLDTLNNMIKGAESNGGEVPLTTINTKLSLGDGTHYYYDPSTQREARTSNPIETKLNDENLKQMSRSLITKQAMGNPQPGEGSPLTNEIVQELVRILNKLDTTINNFKNRSVNGG